MIHDKLSLITIPIKWALYSFQLRLTLTEVWIYLESSLLFIFTMATPCLWMEMHICSLRAKRQNTKKDINFVVMAYSQR